MHPRASKEPKGLIEAQTSVPEQIFPHCLCFEWKEGGAEGRKGKFWKKEETKEGGREENKAKGMEGEGRKKEKAKETGVGEKKKLDDQNFVSILQSSGEWPGLELACRDWVRVGYM